MRRLIFSLLFIAACFGQDETGIHVDLEHNSVTFYPLPSLQAKKTYASIICEIEEWNGVATVRPDGSGFWLLDMEDLKRTDVNGGIKFACHSLSKRKWKGLK
jgi:hypothetical protein